MCQSIPKTERLDLLRGDVAPGLSEQGELRRQRTDLLEDFARGLSFVA